MCASMGFRVRVNVSYRVSGVVLAIMFNADNSVLNSIHYVAQ